MLIKLISIHTCPSSQSVPLACAFLKAYAFKYADSIELVNFFIGDDIELCAANLAECCPDAIGFSMYVWNRNLICEIAAELRRRNPAIKLFCGGPEVTAAPEAITGTGTFDFVIVGEGEVPFLSLCQQIAGDENYSEIPGVMKPESPPPPPPPPLANLDSIPSPYLKEVMDTCSNQGILWQLSRGCSFTCDFCFDARGIHGVRHFSLERVEAELRHFAASGVSQVFVLDSTFNLDATRAKKILKMIKSITPDIHFHFEVRSEFIDKEMAKLFAQITCSIQIGLQSADREVLKLVGRSFNKADFTAKTGLLNMYGVVFGFDLIYGLPGDTLNGFYQTLNYALSLYPNHLDVFPLAVLPGTRLASHGADFKIKWNPSPPYIVESTDRFGATDMISASEFATACDIFYTRGKAVAWFNAVVAALALKPSEFLSKFSKWLIHRQGLGTIESDYSDANVWELQQLFISHLFADKKTKRFLPLVLDLLNYHRHYAEVLLAPTMETRVNHPIPANLHGSRFKLAPSARIIHFAYEIDEILDCGEPRIVWMYENLAQSGSQAVIYRNNDAICTESLAAPYIHLLEQIRDNDSRCDALETSLTCNETDEFIFFALQERIIVNF